MGDYIHVAKNMEGFMSTYTKISRRDFVRQGYCPYTILIPSVDPLSSENVPLCICITQIRVRDAVSRRVASTQFAH